MNQEELFIKKITKAVNSSNDIEQLAENLAKVDIPQSDDFTINVSILADYLAEFQFDWENEAFDNEDEFVAEAATKIKQILTDIKLGNEYRKIFSSKLVYSQLEADNYSYKVVNQKMSAKSVDEAIEEKGEVRAKAPKQHPEDNKYSLEDVRVMVKVVDQNENIVLEEKFVLN